jgi:uncharacterized low-complexity protein
MNNPIKQKAVAAAVGSLLIGSVAGISIASADSPFAMTSLESGYMVAEAKMGEGKCGGGMAKAKGDDKVECETKADDKTMKEGKCGEGKCGGGMAKAKGDDKVECESKADDKKMKEGKCGEAKCGEGKCGSK